MADSLRRSYSNFALWYLSKSRQPWNNIQSICRNSHNSILCNECG